MRTLRKVLTSVIFFLLIIFDFSSAQHWLRDANNPVLSGGEQGTWNHHLMWLSALYNPDSARYEMWFTATSGQTSTWRPMHIGYATSSDGITWNMYPDPVLEPSTEGWDKWTVETPCVIREENGQYKIWYGASNHYNDIFKIGYATSPDGINWTKDSLNNPVMIPGSDAWQIQGFDSPCVMPFEGGYKMWFAGWSANWGDSNIGYATSPDGITWTPDTINNPVLTKGTNGRWDDGNVGDPVVLLIGGTYYMWYCGKKPSEGAPWQTGWATSNDGINWIKYNDFSTNSASFIDSDPVIKRENASGRWDEMYTAPGAVMINEDRSVLYMWYNGQRTGSSWKVGLATAPVILNVPGDYPTIQAAIDAAVDNNVVLVADGTYQENINFKGKAITVASHFLIDNDTSHISNTIIDGSNPSDPDSGSVVTFESGEDTTSVLMGFTLTGGTGTITQFIWDGTHPIRAGGGVFCYDAGARITDNKITKNNIPNYVETTGGGIAALLVNNSDYVIIESNQIVNNTLNGTNSWGSALWLNNDGIIIKNRIAYNTTNATDQAWGAVAGGSDPSNPRNLTIQDNNIIHHNQVNGQSVFGGGVSIEGGMSASITGNEISYNTLNGSVSGLGGGIEISLQGATTSIINNIIFNNSATKGGGLNIQNSEADIVMEVVNNTIVNNSANTGGGIWTNRKPVVFNTIVWGNTADIDPQLSGSFKIRYSDIEGEVFEGEGNISADPLFEDSLFNLSDSSWCVGNGISSIEINGNWYSCPNTDYFGNPRPNDIDHAVDMGAIESPYDSVGIVGIGEESKKNLPFKFALFQNYPNPFNPKTVIRYELPITDHLDLSIYNILGQKVATLVNKKQPAGNYKVEWDASDFASGIYYYKLTTGDPSTSSGGRFQQAKKMILIK